MIIKTAQFVTSNTELKKCPQPNMPEYAFVGRSNVGKSSLINLLTNHSKLAKISATPGKTQLINHFVINNEWYLVDLPGYGYAKTSKKLRNAWDGFTKEYLLKRENIVCIFVLIDVRLKPQKIDLDFMFNLANNSLPFAMVFTKADKLSKKQLADNLKFYFAEMEKEWESLPVNFITSAHSKTGREELLDYIDSLNNSEVSEIIKNN